MADNLNLLNSLSQEIHPRQDTRGRPLHARIADSQRFAEVLMQQCDWFSGVPDSVIRKVLPRLTPYHFAPRENHAIGMAFGAAIAGKRPCVLMQNSGLGLALDALLGLFGLYRQGLLLIISNRGELPWEEIQHHDWGRITLPLLQQTGWPLIDYQREGLSGLKRAARLATDEKQIAVMMVHRGNLDEAQAE
jgi:sulfopyruvate decarboxylase subunit alpha